METIGVRQLRQSASEWLRRVEAGESFEVTARGRPVARLVPIYPDDILARLTAEHALHWAEGDVLALDPLPGESGLESLTEILRARRVDER